MKLERRQHFLMSRRCRLPIQDTTSQDSAFALETGYAQLTIDHSAYMFAVNGDSAPDAVADDFCRPYHPAQLSHLDVPCALFPSCTSA